MFSSVRWDLFIKYTAQKFGLNFRQMQVFNSRFAWENQDKTDEQIFEYIEPLLHVSKGTYIDEKQHIYRLFEQHPDGYPELKNCRQKYQELLAWLKAKYQDRLYSYYPDRISDRVERELEAQCYCALLEPKAFIRVRASQKMGKTSLLKRVLKEFSNKGFTTLRFDFNSLEQDIFQNYSRFCYSFCAGVGEQLNLPEQITESWQRLLGCNQNTTKYFERYILAQVDKPLILGLDGLDCVFEHQLLAENFCKLLRSWKDNHRPIWQELRLIIVHSTDVYSGLDINSSPLAGIGRVFFYPR